MPPITAPAPAPRPRPTMAPAAAPPAAPTATFLARLRLPLLRLFRLDLRWVLRVEVAAISGTTVSASSPADSTAANSDFFITHSLFFSGFKALANMSAPAAPNERVAATSPAPPRGYPNCARTRRNYPSTRHPRVAPPASPSPAPSVIATGPNQPGAGRSADGSANPMTRWRCPHYLGGGLGHGAVSR